jgi:hypothetical protein
LAAPEAGNPCSCTLQAAPQRSHFARLAAGEAGVARDAVTGDAISSHERLDLVRIGSKDADAHSVALLRPRKGFERLGKQAAGVQGKDVNGSARRSDGMLHGLILQADAGGKHNSARNSAGDLPHPVLQRNDPRKDNGQLAG